MKTRTRILINLLGPVAIASPLLSLAITVFDAPRLSAEKFVGTLGLFAFYGYIVGAIPSALHAAFMEWVYRRRAATHDAAAVRYSTVSGFVAGAIFGALLGDLLVGGLFIAAGTLTGFLLGLLIRRCSRANPAPEGSAP